MDDTPGFLGNRVGVYAMQVAMTEAFKMKLSIEEVRLQYLVDLWVYQKQEFLSLYDLIGNRFDVRCFKSFKELDSKDEFQNVVEGIPIIKNLIDKAVLQDLKKGWFYRINKEITKKHLRH